jgi:putative flippase GtrA
VSVDHAVATNALGRLVARFRHLLRELGKFGIVGAVAYVVDSVLFNILLLSMWWLPAKTLATVVAATVAFVGNRFWTWRDRERSNLTREYVLYFVFNAIGLGIGLFCLWVSHDLLGRFRPDIFHTRLADNVAALVVGMALGTMFRFWAYRTIVFVPVPSAAGGVPAAPGGGAAGSLPGAPGPGPHDTEGHREREPR